MEEICHCMLTCRGVGFVTVDGLFDLNVTIRPNIKKDRQIMFSLNKLTKNASEV